MPSYTNNGDKVNLITKTGAEIIASGYSVDLSSILDSTSDLAGTLADKDEIIVVRKFASTSVSPSITAGEAWSAYTLPNLNTSGSSMYSMAGSTATFSAAAADYTWTVSMSGRAADVVLPVLAAADSVYFVRRVHNLDRLVNWTSGAKVSSKNLNIGTEQILAISQELMTYFKNFHTINPSIGRPNGIVPLNSLGVIDAAYVNANTLSLTSENGVSGVGTVGDPLTLTIDGDSLIQSASGVKADTINTLVSGSETKPLSAKMGKELNDRLTTLGSGVNYRGAFDVTTVSYVASGLATAVAGDSVGVTVSGNALASWASLAVVAGTLIRHNGTSWQLTGDQTPVLVDGSAPLTADWNAGSTRTISAKTQTTGDNTTKLATTAFVTSTVAATPITTLLNVNDTVDDTTGNVMYWSGSEWTPKVLNVVAGDILTTSSVLSSLNNVATTTPTDNQVLQWDTTSSTWVPGSVDSTAYDIISAGTADGSTNDYVAVKAALTSATLGHTGTSSNTTISTLNFRGRQHNIVSATGASGETLVMPCREDITIKNGSISIEYNECVDKELMRANGVATKLQTNTSVEYRRGAHVIKVDSTTGFVVGDMIRIVGTPVHDVREKVSNDSPYTHAAYHMANITYITDSTTMSIDPPLPTKFVVDSLVSREGEGTAGATQMRNVVFENMRFKDKLGKSYFLNDVAASATPLAVTNGSALVDFTAPTGHGMSQSGGGAILLQDADLGGDGTNHIVNKSSYVNKWMTLTSATTATAFTSTMGATVVGSTGSYGGDVAYVTQSRQRGIHVRNGENIVFRDCVFENFNGQHAVLIDRCKGVVFENCTFSNCRGTSETVDGKISSCILIRASVNVSIRNCTFTSCLLAVRTQGDLDDSVDTTVQRVGCRDISMSNCHVNATKIFEGDAFVYGKCEFTDCKFVAFNPNTRRCHIRVTSDSDHRDGAACERAINLSNGVEELIVHNCEFGGCGFTANEEADGDTMDTTKFWGRGDGWTRSQYGPGTAGNIVVNDENVLPAWYQPLYAVVQPDSYGDKQYFRSGSVTIPVTTKKSFSVVGNSFSSYYYSIGIRWAYNYVGPGSSTQDHAWPKGEIRNNECVGGLYGIYLSNHSTSEGHEGIWGLNISENTIFTYAPAGRVPGQFKGVTGSGGSTVTYTRNWQENDLRGIWVRFANTEYTNNGGGKGRAVHVQHNHVSGAALTQSLQGGTLGTYSSQGIILGTSGDTNRNSTIYQSSVRDNHISSYTVGIYSYRSGQDHSRSMWGHSVVANNYMTDVNNWFNVYNLFIADSHNRSYDNYVV